MIGVVIWSDHHDRKAVFWCEDQGDLAFYEAAEGEEAGFDAGDMVQFEVTIDARFRRAHNPTLLLGKACATLPAALRGSHSVTAKQDGDGSAKIIAFGDGEMRRAAAQRRPLALSKRKA